MPSARRGKSTLAVEIGNVSTHGFWILVGEAEYFLPFSKFPWFRDAPIGHVLNVKLLRANHLYWPDLDVDLTLDVILHPEKYPLASRERPSEPCRSKKKASPRRRSRLQK